MLKVLKGILKIIFLFSEKKRLFDNLSLFYFNLLLLFIYLFQFNLILTVNQWYDYYTKTIKINRVKFQALVDFTVYLQLLFYCVVFWPCCICSLLFSVLSSHWSGISQSIRVGLTCCVSWCNRDKNGAPWTSENHKAKGSTSVKENAKTQISK